MFFKRIFISHPSEVIAIIKKIVKYVCEILTRSKDIIEVSCWSYTEISKILIHFRMQNINTGLVLFENI